MEKEIVPLTTQTAVLDGLTKEYQDSKRAYDEILDFVRRFTMNDEMMFDHVTIMERASGTVEDMQEWILPIAIGAIAGGVAGLILSLLIAAVIHAATPAAKPPLAP